LREPTKVAGRQHPPPCRLAAV